MRGILDRKAARVACAALAAGMLLGVPALARRYIPMDRAGVIRIYNPQAFAQSGTVRVTPFGQPPGGADVITPYTLNAHNVQEIQVTAGLVVVAPADDGQGNPLSDPVVDAETNPEGGIASPALFTDLSVKHATGNGTGNALIIGKEGGQVVVSQYQADGKPIGASTLALPMGGAITTPVNGTFSVDFLNGTGAVAFEAGEQRAIDASHSLLSTTASWWVKPPSIVLKPSMSEVRNIVAADVTTFATYLSQDSTFLAKYGSLDTIKYTLASWTDGVQTNGEFASIPIKVVGSQLYLMLSSSTDVAGLSNKKVPAGYKVTVNAPNGRETMLALLGGEIERNPTVYYSTVNPATRPNALWAKKKMNASITGAQSLAAEGGSLVPYVTADTAITLTNASPFSATYTVRTAAMGSDPRVGAGTQITLSPGQTQTLENLVSSESSAYIATSGNKPAVSATQTGLDIPALPEEYANNASPQAIIMQSGEEGIRTLSGGPHNGNNVITYMARGSDGTAPVTSEPSYIPPFAEASSTANGLVHQVRPNNTFTMMPDVPTQSKAGMVAIYENSANLDQRIRAGQGFTTIRPPGFDSTCVIRVMNDGVLESRQTYPSEDVVRRIMGYGNGTPDTGIYGYVCNDMPIYVFTLQHLINQYNTQLSEAQQAEFAGDRTWFAPFVNTSTPGTYPCDPSESDGKFISIVEITVQAYPHPAPIEYDCWAEIYVMDNGHSLFTGRAIIQDATMKRWLGINDLSQYVGERQWMAKTPPATLEYLISRFNHSLSRAEQDEVSNNNTDESVPFFNDSDLDGTPCDEGETDGKFVYFAITSITPKACR